MYFCHYLVCVGKSNKKNKKNKKHDSRRSFFVASEGRPERPNVSDRRGGSRHLVRKRHSCSLSLSISLSHTNSLRSSALIEIKGNHSKSTTKPQQTSMLSLRGNTVTSDVTLISSQAQRLHDCHFYCTFQCTNWQQRERAKKKKTLFNLLHLTLQLF